VNSVVEKLLVIFNALDHDSKLLFLAKADTPTRTGGSPEADPTFKVTHIEVWMRRVDAYDGKGIGVMALVGDWMKEDDIDGLDDGTIVLIGAMENVEGPCKMYMIARREARPNSNAKVRLSTGATLDGLDPCTGWLGEWREVVWNIQKFV
jgi:hypothetical protein